MQTPDFISMVRAAPPEAAVLLIPISELISLDLTSGTQKHVSAEQTRIFGTLTYIGLVIGYFVAGVKLSAAMFAAETTAITIILPLLLFALAAAAVLAGSIVLEQAFEIGCVQNHGSDCTYCGCIDPANGKPTNYSTAKECAQDCPTSLRCFALS